MALLPIFPSAPARARTLAPAEAPIALRALPPLTSAISASNAHTSRVCPITHEPISAYSPADVFTTLGGSAYHRPSLKVWLQDHNTLPHHGLEAFEEIARLRSPQPQAKMTDLAFAMRIIYGLNFWACAVGWSEAQYLQKFHLPPTRRRIKWPTTCVWPCRPMLLQIA